MSKLRNLFESPVLRGEVTIFPRKKKIGNKFYQLYFIKKRDGEFIGKKMGYDTKEEAVRALLSMKDKNFMRKNSMKQKKRVDSYIKTHKL